MSPDASVFVGLDCGGSTTRVLAVTRDGQSVFEGQSGSANLATTSPPVLVENLKAACQDCPTPVSVCGCFAGMLTDADRARAESYLTEIFPSATVRAETDYAAAFRSAEHPIDVCVISGTGSLICSRIEGEWIRTGGGGYLLGDIGSAFDVGRRALRAWLQAEGALSERLNVAVEQTFQTRKPNEVIAALYASPAPAAKLARLAEPVAKDAAAGEPYAYQVLEAALGELCCEVVKHVSRRLPGSGTVRFGLAGGFWRASSTVQRVFESALGKALNRDHSVERISRPPVWGAVALAMELTLVN